MSNMIDYVKTYQESMQRMPFTEVDSLVLAQLAYLSYPHITTAVRISDMATMIQVPTNDNASRELLAAVIASRRFQNLQVLDYLEEMDVYLEKQFAVVTFLLETGQLYIAFRGTDGTLTGWKEDFNMAFQYPIPSQTAALAYVCQTASLYGKPFYLGGHSKGGNLAVYAACLLPADLQKYLLYVFSHDGPGFHQDFLDACYFGTIKTKLKKTVPECSLIGMLLFTQERYTIVKSNRFYIMEHDPFSWEIEENHFIVVDQLSDGSIYTNLVLHQWLAGLSYEQREKFVDIIFMILNKTGVTTFQELLAIWPTNIIIILKTMNELDDEEKFYVWETLKSLILIAIKRLPSILLN